MRVFSVLESPQDFLKQPLAFKAFTGNHNVNVLKRPLAVMDPNVNGGNCANDNGGNEGWKGGGHDAERLRDGQEEVFDDVDDDMPPLADNPFPSAVAHPSTMPPNMPPAFRAPIRQTLPGQQPARGSARGVTPVQFTFAVNLTPSMYAPHAHDDGVGAAWRAAGTSGANNINFQIASGAGIPMGADNGSQPADAPLPSGMAMAMMPEDEEDDMPPLVDRPSETEANAWNSSARFADSDFANPIAKHQSVDDLMDEDEDDEVESNSLSFNSSFTSPMRSPSSPAMSPSYTMSPGGFQGGIGPGGYSFSRQFPVSPPGLEAKPIINFESNAPTANGNSNAQKKSSARPASYIPRPPNAFILFRASFVRAHSANASGIASASTPSSTDVSGNHRMPSPRRGSNSVGVATGNASTTAGIGSTSLSKLAGQAWRALPASEREVWERKALAAQAEHRKKYPDWRFRPGNVSGMRIRDGGGGGSGSGTGDPGGSSKDAKEKGPANKAQNPGSGDRRSPGAATTSSSGSSSKRRAARNVHIAPESPTTHRMGSFSSSPGGLDQGIVVTSPVTTRDSNSGSPKGAQSPGGSKKRYRRSSNASTTSNASVASNASTGSTGSTRSAKRSRNGSSESVASGSGAANGQISSIPSSPPASSLASSSTVKAEGQQTTMISSPAHFSPSAPPEPANSNFRPILEQQAQSSPIAPSMLFEHYPPIRRSPVLSQNLSRGGSPLILETPVVPPLPTHPSDGITPMQRNANMNLTRFGVPPLRTTMSPFAAFPGNGGVRAPSSQVGQATSLLTSRFETNYPSSQAPGNVSPPDSTTSVTTFSTPVIYNGGFNEVGVTSVDANGQGSPSGSTIVTTPAPPQNQQAHLSTYSTLEGWAGGSASNGMMSPLQQHAFGFSTESAQVSQAYYHAPTAWYDANGGRVHEDTATNINASASSSVNVNAAGTQQQQMMMRASPDASQQPQPHAVYPEMRQEDQYAFLSDGTYLLQDYYRAGELQHPQK